MTRDDQAAAIAHFRMHGLIERNTSDAIEDAAERRMAAGN